MDVDNDPDIMLTETYLQTKTLWQEVDKLYGHGYEISAVGVSPNGAILASACRVHYRVFTMYN